MNAKDYSKLCDVVASLNIALCAMNDEHNKDMVNPKEIAKAQVQKAYLLVDKMLIKKSNYDNQ